MTDLRPQATGILRHFISNQQSRTAASEDPKSPFGLEQEFPLGAHLATSRHGYTHHGIYVGNGKAVHYAGLCRSWHSGPVEEVCLSRFAFGNAVRVIKHRESRYSAREIVQRARSRLGEDHYNLLTNNCEHFVNWCTDGRSCSAQVRQRMAIPSLTFTLAALLAVCLPRLLM
jgi:Lecithin retinol acyltransferase